MFCCRRLPPTISAINTTATAFQSEGFLLSKFQRPPQGAHFQEAQSTRHLNTFVESALQYTVVYAGNSYMARAFVDAYQAIGGISCFGGSTAGVVCAALACRLITFPLFAVAEKVFAKRVVANQIIRRHVYEEAAEKSGEKTIFDVNTGRITFATPDKPMTNSEERKRLETMNRLDDLCYKTQYAYAIENKVQLYRIICLKICTFPLWMQTAVGLRASIDHTNINTFYGFLWVPSFGQTDPYMLFPIAFGVLSFLNLWTTKWMYVAPQATGQIWLKRGLSCFFAAFTIIGVRLLVDMPAIQSLYFCTIMSSALAQTLALRHPRVKKLLGIGKLPTDTSTPIRDLFRTKRKFLPPMFN